MIVDARELFEKRIIKNFTNKFVYFYTKGDAAGAGRVIKSAPEHLRDKIKYEVRKELKKDN